MRALTGPACIAVSSHNSSNNNDNNDKNNMMIMMAAMIAMNDDDNSYNGDDEMIVVLASPRVEVIIDVATAASIICGVGACELCEETPIYGMPPAGNH